MQKLTVSQQKFQQRENFPKYLEEVIDAEPEQIVLPCAGTGEIYERGRTEDSGVNFWMGVKELERWLIQKIKI